MKIIWAIGIIGGGDITTSEHAAEMHRLISNSRLAVIPGWTWRSYRRNDYSQDSVLMAATLHY